MKMHFKISLSFFIAILILLGCSNKETNTEDINVNEVFSSFKQQYESSSHVIEFKFGAQSGTLYIYDSDSYAIKVANYDSHIFINCGINDKYALSIDDKEITSESFIVETCEEGEAKDEILSKVAFENVSKTVGEIDAKRTDEYFVVAGNDIKINVYMNSSKVVYENIEGEILIEIKDIILP